MNAYFIDYENVKESGLNGIEFLDKKDALFIFYSEHACKLTFHMMEELNAAVERGASVELYEVKCTRDNALDFQLVMKIGNYCITQMEDSSLDIYIVSNDKGFDSVVQGYPYLSLRSPKSIRIKRISSILATHEETSEEKTEESPEETIVKTEETENKEETKHSNEKETRLLSEIELLLGQCNPPIPNPMINRLLDETPVVLRQYMENEKTRKSYILTYFNSFIPKIFPGKKNRRLRSAVQNTCKTRIIALGEVYRKEYA